MSYVGRLASAFTRSPDCSGGPDSRSERTVYVLSASCQSWPFVMLRDACKGARLSGLNSSQLFQEDQEVASERAIFSSSEYPKMSSIQDAGKYFTPLLVLKAMWVLEAFFQALSDFRDLT